MDRPSAEALDALLPQTQCTRCGYAGCRPYADAMAAGDAGPNRCPPGGPSTLAALGAALGVPATALDPACGEFGAPQVAVIDEAACIGCAKCLPACPVDAILGARKFLHTVITADCNGCALCIAPCPVDCITLVPTGAPALSAGQLSTDAGRYRARYAAHRARGAQREAKRTAALAARAERLRVSLGAPTAQPDAAP